MVAETARPSRLPSVAGSWALSPAMHKATVLSISLLILLLGFEVIPLNAGQPTAPKIASVYKTLAFAEMTGVTRRPKAAGDALLLVRIEGVDLDQVRRAKLRLVAGKAVYKNVFLETSAKRTVYPDSPKRKVFKPFILMCFVIPKNLTKAKLLVGDLPPADLSISSTISNKVDDLSIE